MSITPKIVVNKLKSSFTIAARCLGRLKVTPDELSVLEVPVGDTLTLDGFAAAFGQRAGLAHDIRALPWVKDSPIAPGDVLRCRGDGKGNIPKQAIGGVRFVALGADRTDIRKCFTLLLDNYGVHVPEDAFLALPVTTLPEETANYVLVLPRAAREALLTDTGKWEGHLDALLRADPNARFVFEDAVGGSVFDLLEILRNRETEPPEPEQDEQSGF